MIIFARKARDTYIDSPLIPCAPLARQAALNLSNGSLVVANACLALISSSFCRRADAAIALINQVRNNQDFTDVWMIEDSLQLCHKLIKLFWWISI